MSIFPFDSIELLRAELNRGKRPPDGYLHPSSHLAGSLRHIQLDAAGAPQLEGDTASEINLEVGTAMHALMERAYRGKPVMTEVNLKGWLPEGWNGTADILAWDADVRAFVLGDWKFVKGGNIHWINADGAKYGHILQVSAYWHALVAMGLPMVHGAMVTYLPKNQLSASEGSPVKPTEQVIVPLPEDVVVTRMNEQREKVNAYLATLAAGGNTDMPEFFLTDGLAPVQGREFKLVLNKALKRPVIDVMLAPNWSTAYCPFPDELCDCRHQTTNKIGSWDRDDSGQLVYTPRKGDAPADLPEGEPPAPSPQLISALVKVQKEKANAA